MSRILNDFITAPILLPVLKDITVCIYKYDYHLSAYLCNVQLPPEVITEDYTELFPTLDVLCDCITWFRPEMLIIT